MTLMTFKKKRMRVFSPCIFNFLKWHAKKWTTQSLFQKAELQKLLITSRTDWKFSRQLVFFFHLQTVHKLILIFPKWIYNFQKYTPAGEEVHKHNGSALPNSLWLLWITQPSPAHWTKPAALLQLLTCFPLGFSLFAIQGMWLLICATWFDSTAWLDEQRLLK